MGIRIVDIEKDFKLNKMITPLAVFSNTGKVSNPMSMVKEEDSVKYSEKKEFVAIAEFNDFPIYIFTYNIEMNQFVYSDLIKSENQEEILDKSIPTRHHCQYIANQIADEARLSKHKFAVTEKEYTKLIRHHKLASVQYSKSQNSNSPMPLGLESHDVYMIKQEMPVSSFSEPEISNSSLDEKPEIF